MKKRIYFVTIILFVAISYVWFAILPECTGLSFPTGGWDWLGFIGVIISVSFAVWGICKQIEISNKQTKDQISASNEQVKKQIVASNEQVERQIQESQEQVRLQIKENLRLMIKQQQLSVVPCLDVNPYISFDPTRKNNVFCRFVEINGRIINDGYRLCRGEKEKPDRFQPRVNVRIRNVGLSVAMGVTVYLYELTSVDGVEALSSIPDKPIDNFYERSHFANYTYYESELPDADPVLHDWIIAPEYNISLENDEVNLVFDCSKITKGYHSIIKLAFQDIYKNEYYQLMYLYFDNQSCGAMPVSKLFTVENPLL